MTGRTARKWPHVALFMLIGAWCAQCADLHIAAAANLSSVIPEIARAFGHKTGVQIVPSFGATAQLTQQIENGAPFDVFLAADTGHIDELVKVGLVLSVSRAVYARGRLVVWAPSHPEIRSIADLAKPGVRTIAVATPSLAPYGAAAIETLKGSGIWDTVQPRLVYAPSIATAKQFADTGNAEAAFTAYALTKEQSGNQFTVDEKAHKPIDQAMGIVAGSKAQGAAHAFAAFMTSTEGRAIMRRFGYIEP